MYREFIADRRAHESVVARPFDKHHIFPRSLGGGDEAENIIRLSPPDHIFAHMLLAKIHGGTMVRAVYGMLHGARYSGRRSRRQYTWLRAQLGEVASRAVRAANERRGHGANKGRALSEGAKAKMVATKRARFERYGGPVGRKISDGARAAFRKTPEHRAKIGAANRAAWVGRDHPMKGKTRDPALVAKTLKTKADNGYSPHPMKGKKMPPEHGAKISATRIAKFAAIRQQRAISALSSLCGQ